MGRGSAQEAVLLIFSDMGRSLATYLIPLLWVFVQGLQMASGHTSLLLGCCTNGKLRPRQNSEVLEQPPSSRKRDTNLYVLKTEIDQAMERDCRR